MYSLLVKRLICIIELERYELIGLISESCELTKVYLFRRSANLLPRQIKCNNGEQGLGAGKNTYKRSMEVPPGATENPGARG
jgi:hypothetical protein